MTQTRFHVTPSPPTMHLDILVYREGDCFVAHCIQLDLVHSSKKSKDAVFEQCMDVCYAHVLFAFENNRLDTLFRPPDPGLVAKMLRAKLMGTFSVRFRAKLNDDEIESGLEFQRLAA